MKAFIVANYASGVGKCALFMPTVERVLQKENIEYSVFRTVDKETDIRTVRENINNLSLIDVSKFFFYLILYFHF